MSRSRERLIMVAGAICLSVLFGWLFSFLSNRKAQEAAPDPERKSRHHLDSPASTAGGEARPRAPGEQPRVAPLTADTFDEEWQKLMNSELPESHKVTLLGQLVFKMSKLGHTEEATRKIIDSFGPGNNRNSLLRICFNTFSEGAELSGAYALLEFDDEKQSARRGIASHAARLAFESKAGFSIDPQKFGFLKEDLPELRENAAIAYVDMCVRDSPERAKEALQAVLTDDLTPAARNSILSTMAPFIPFETWDKFHTAGKPGDHQTGLAIVDRMLSRDPAATLQTLGKGDVTGDYIPKAVQDWMSKDATKPIEWVEANRSSLRGPQLDGAIAGIVSYSAGVGERETAYAWAQQVGDKETKRKLLEALDKRFPKPGANP